MGLQSKLETVLWYARRPELRAELWRKVRTGAFTLPWTETRRQENRSAAKAWCQEELRSPEEAASILGVPLHVVAARKAGDLDAAAEACAQVPVRMGGPGDLDLLYSLVLGLRPSRVLETGVAYGWSSLAILLALEEAGRGRLTSLDMPYAKMGNEDFVGSAVVERLRDRWDLRRLPDAVGLRHLRMEGARFGLAHYDSDKSYAGRRTSYPAIWEMLEDGGVLMSDDIVDNFGFRDFADEVAREAIVVSKTNGSGFVGFLRK